MGAGRVQRLAPRVAVLLSVLVPCWVGIPSLASASAQENRTRTAALTSSGTLLQSFEALLHERYGVRHVCASDRIQEWHFTSMPTDCAPTVRYREYDFQFASWRNTQLRVSRHVYRDQDFGNHSEVVLVGGHPVECLGSPRTYLITSDVSLDFSLGCASTSYDATHVRAGPPTASLTASGRLTRNFERLLRARYGSGDVCAFPGNDAWHYTSGLCSPLSTYSEYDYRFARDGVASTLRLSGRNYRQLYLGNVETVLVAGHPVACPTSPRAYLVMVPGAPFSLSCSVAS